MIKKGAIYKTVDLFGNEQTQIAPTLAEKPNLFSNYEGFVEKFEAKKTTDDCYTPSAIYKIVLDYVAERYDLTGKRILRPFYPDGDYQSIEYGPEDVVIDNPPFSIITQICRYYIARGVPFFLFAPHLTLFSAGLDCTHIVAGCDVVYANGANVKTSFLSNMMGDLRVIGEPLLFKAVREYNDANRERKPVYEYPANILMVSHVQWCVERGIGFQMRKESAKHYRQMDAQKQHVKTLFGSGFIISDAAAAEKAAAEKAAAEKAAAEKAAAEKENVIIWPLSKKEREIIEKLK
jgi:hypothetical protein